MIIQPLDVIEVIDSNERGEPSRKMHIFTFFLDRSITYNRDDSVKFITNREIEIDTSLQNTKTNKETITIEVPIYNDEMRIIGDNVVCRITKFSPKLSHPSNKQWRSIIDA